MAILSTIYTLRNLLVYLNHYNIEFKNFSKVKPSKFIYHKFHLYYLVKIYFMGHVQQIFQINN